MHNSGIYIITNTITNKIYIGSSVNIKERWKTHKKKLKSFNHPNKHLQASVNKYSIELFTFEILLYCSKENLLFYEQRAIDKYKPEYNKAKIAGSPMLGMKHTEEAKSKIGKASLGNTYGSLCKGKNISETTKQRQSIAMLGHSVSEETRLKIANSLSGSKDTEETKQKKSEAQRIRWARKRAA